jgi:hypothetical protein
MMEKIISYIKRQYFNLLDINLVSISLKQELITTGNYTNK